MDKGAYAMRLAIVCLTVAAVFAAAPGAVGKGPIPLKPSVECDVKLNVVDRDPKGLNVRTTPQILPNNIRTVIPLSDWTRVHVVGEAGDWYLIDGYEVFPDSGEDRDEQLPGGHRDWVHKSKLGGVRSVAGAMMYAEPNARGKYLIRFKPDEELVVLGCSGAFLKVRAQGTVGWTREVCTNERTTCA
jgi:hypothetical protein